MPSTLDQRCDFLPPGAQVWRDGGFRCQTERNFVERYYSQWHVEKYCFKSSNEIRQGGIENCLAAQDELVPMGQGTLQDFLQMRLNISDRIRFFRNYWQFRNQREHSSHEFLFGKLYPCLRDWHDSSGTASGHYFHQDLLVAQKVYAEKPVKHVDVGSRIDGFVAHVAAFRQIEVFDVRPLQSPHSNIIFVQADFMGDCTKLAHYCDSLSCLHALEHFGLGRYGDVVDYEGHLKGFRNLAGILKIGGTLYFSVPIGPQRVEFNAHRIFDLRYLMRLFEKQFRVDTFSYVDDVGDLHQDVPTSGNSFDNNFACSYGCGIFELTKVAD